MTVPEGVESVNISRRPEAESCSAIAPGYLIDPLLWLAVLVLTMGSILFVLGCYESVYFLFWTGAEFYLDISPFCSSNYSLSAAEARDYFFIEIWWKNLGVYSNLLWSDGLVNVSVETFACNCIVACGLVVGKLELLRKCSIDFKAPYVWNKDNDWPMSAVLLLP